MILDAIPFPSSLQSEYDRFAEWFQILSPVYYEPRKTELLAEFIMKKKGKDISILDCACGLGLAAVDLKKIGFRVTGSDVSNEMLKFAKAYAASESVRMLFQQSDWRELYDKIKGKFDCVINLGVNIYHLKDQDTVDALTNMKRMLVPGGLLIIDNKNWRPLLEVENGNRHIRYIEHRFPLRVYSVQPLKATSGKSYYFFDVSWLKQDRWIIEVVKLPADELNSVIKCKGSFLLDIHGILVSCKIEDNEFKVDIDKEIQEEADKSFPFESISLPGWPITSIEIKGLLDQIGMEDIKIEDKAGVLNYEDKEREKGHYDIIIATNPG